MPDRDRHVRRARATLDAWSAEIGRQEAAMRAANDEGNLEWQTRVESMRSRRGEAQDALAHLEAADPHEADAAVERFEREWGRISGGFQEASGKVL